MNTELTVLIIIIVAGIAGYVGYSTGFIKGMKDDMVELVAKGIKLGFEKREEAISLTCVHPECKRRKTDSEYLNTRLLLIGYQEYCRRKENDKKAIIKTLSLCCRCEENDSCEKGGNEIINCDEFVREIMDENSIEPYGVIWDGEDLCYIGDLTDMGFKEKEVFEINWMITKIGLIGTHPNHKPIKASPNKVEFIDSISDPLSLCQRCDLRESCEKRDDEFINCDEFVKEKADEG